LSPEVLFQYESFSSLMNQKPYPGQSLSFEYRSLQPVWIGLGSQFRLITDHRVWEFTPQVYYSPYGSTSLSVTGTHEIISGWKMALKVETSLWKSIWGGIDLNAFYLSHSTQFRGFMSFFRLSYRFN